MSGTDVTDGDGEEVARGGSEDDAVWLELIGRFDAPADSSDAPAPWPERENLFSSGSSGPGEAGPVGLGPARPWPERENLPPSPSRPSDLGSWTGGRPSRPVYRQFELPAPPADPRSWTAPDDEDEEHYTPPPPPPLPSMSPVTKGAWVALFGGPAYLLTATLASWSVAGWALFLAIAAFVGGFTVLALRLGDRPDDGSGPDDGAVV